MVHPPATGVETISGERARLRSERSLIGLYFGILVLTFSPLKSVAYFLPILFIAGCVVGAGLRPRALRGVALAATLLLAWGVVHALVYAEFLWINFALGLLTYAVLLTMAVDFGPIVSLSLLYRLFRLTFVFVAAQAAYGVVQSVYSAVVVGRGTFDDFIGDAVKGTINPILVGDGRGSNQMFAILVSLFLLLLYPSRRFFLPATWRWAFWVIGLSWILASVMHTVFFAAAAILVVAVLLPPWVGWPQLQRRGSGRVRGLASGMLAALVILGLVRLFLPGNLRNVGHYVSTTVSSFSAVDPLSPKVVATLNTLYRLPQEAPPQPWIGLGLGQYSSRAGLIMSGTYLAEGFLLAPQSRSVSHDLVYSLQESVRDRNVGSTYFPYYSWLSVYGELGWVGVAAVLFVAVAVVRRLRTSPLPFQEWDALRRSVVLVVAYMLLLGFQDNYWEFAQAICAPLVLGKLSYDYLKTHVAGQSALPAG